MWNKAPVSSSKRYLNNPLIWFMASSTSPITAKNGEVVLRAYELTGDEFYLKAAEKMRDYLKNVAPRSDDGVIFHNDISFDPNFTEKQFWIDSA